MPHHYDGCTYLRLNDRVEDRSLYSGAGHVVYLKGNMACVRFDDGSEETFDMELFVQVDDRRWAV